ncbi:hypothetical protein [Vibrio phage CKB-S2]|nr:hypothetical protein [Vibrio phage CKB-S2]
MGRGFSCKCEERQKPAEQRQWVITQYKWNSGAFTAGDGEYSDYSRVVCLSCGASGRTKAKYVDKLNLMDWREAYELTKDKYGWLDNG